MARTATPTRSTPSGRSGSTPTESKSPNARTGSRRGNSALVEAHPTRHGTSRSLSPEPRLGTPSGEVQRFGTMRLLPIALANEARAESAQQLNAILADTTILYAMYKKHHWLVAGPTFYQLHLLFDKHAGEQLELIDLLAERVQTLGGIAVGDPRHAAEITTIERPPNGAEDVPDMIARTLRAHETIIEKVRAAIEATEKNGDWGSNDILMSEVLRTNELQVWFLSAHLVDMPLVQD